MNTFRNSNPPHWWKPLGGLQQYWRGSTAVWQQVQGRTQLLDTESVGSYLPYTHHTRGRRRASGSTYQDSCASCTTAKRTRRLWHFCNCFALHSLLGDQLLEIEFDQGRMRGHLLECFQKKELTPFPRRQKVGPIRSLYFPYRDIELYCVCLMPDTWKRTMIECDGCSQWYHTECVGLQALPPPTEQWTCSSCS